MRKQTHFRYNDCKQHKLSGNAVQLIKKSCSQENNFLICIMHYCVILLEEGVYRAGLSLFGNRVYFYCNSAYHQLQGYVQARPEHFAKSSYKVPSFDDFNFHLLHYRCHVGYAGRP